MAKIDRVQEVNVDLLVPYANNAKQHSEDQVRKIAESIKEFGFISPCLIDHDYNIIAGHGRVMASKKIGLATVPCVFVEGLTDAQRRAYILADNRLTELGDWDEMMVQEELKRLSEENFNVELTGFELIDLDEIEEPAEPLTNPVENLPDSKFYICAVSAFGVSSEKIIMFKLQQSTADNILKKIEETPTETLVEKLEQSLNEL